MQLTARVARIESLTLGALFFPKRVEESAADYRYTLESAGYYYFENSTY